MVDALTSCRHSVGRRLGVFAALVASAAALWAVPATATAQGLATRCFADTNRPNIVFGPQSFFLPMDVQGPTSFRQNADQSVVTYPLYHGTSRGRRVFYVITDASDLAVARALRVNYAPKIANALGTVAVQVSSSLIWSGRGIDFPASVNFSAQPRILTPGMPDAFPPSQAQPGAIGEPGYSPFVEVDFRGHMVVLDAPQVANGTGRAAKIISINREDDDAPTVSLHEIQGCYDDLSVHYESFDASDPTAAAIENVTYAPAMDAAPSPGCADNETPPMSPTCARQSLAAFTNGQMGLDNPERQGLNNAITDGFSPLNILREVPHPGAEFVYSPMWDVHLATWTDAAVAAGLNVRQTGFDEVLKQVADGNVTGFPAGSPFQASGFIVNCPVVSLNPSSSSSTPEDQDDD